MKFTQTIINFQGIFLYTYDGNKIELRTWWSYNFGLYWKLIMQHVENALTIDMKMRMV